MTDWFRKDIFTSFHHVQFTLKRLKSLHRHSKTWNLTHHFLELECWSSTNRPLLTLFHFPYWQFVKVLYLSSHPQHQTKIFPARLFLLVEPGSFAMFHSSFDLSSNCYKHQGLTTRRFFEEELFSLRVQIVTYPVTLIRTPLISWCTNWWIWFCVSFII